MKHQFNKTFPLLIKQEENAEKPHFGPDLGLLGHNLGHKFFLRFQLYQMLENDKKPNLGPNFGPPYFFREFYLY